MISNNIDQFLEEFLYLLTQNSLKINLKNTTLVSISSINIEQTLLSLVITNFYADFERILLFTSAEIEQQYLRLFPQLEIIKIEPLKNVFEYSRFVIKELNQYIESDYCLITQYDGFILNPEKWDQNFLNYDYIGAPWPEKLSIISQANQVVGSLDLSKNRVGNGGFSLRSKKFLELSAQLDFDNLNFQCKSEDILICHYLYEYFIDHAIKFAPLDLAVKFSFEEIIKEYPQITWKDTFGFHGKNHLMPVFATLAERFDSLINSEEIIIERLKDELNLKEINLIIFPDWLADEEELGLELMEIINNLAHHPEHEKMTLLIDISNLNEEDANLFLQGIAMNLMMELELDITEKLTISLVNSPQDWQLLLTTIDCCLILQHENKAIINQLSIPDQLRATFDNLLI